MTTAHNEALLVQVQSAWEGLVPKRQSPEGCAAVSAKGVI